MVRMKRDKKASNMLKITVRRKLRIEQRIIQTYEPPPPQKTPTTNSVIIGPSAAGMQAWEYNCWLKMYI
jgi:hypothetical protein